MSDDAAPWHVTDRFFFQCQTAKLKLHQLTRFICMQTQLQTTLHFISAQTFTLHGHGLHARHEFRYMAYCATLCAKRSATHAVAAAAAAKEAALAMASAAAAPAAAAAASRMGSIMRLTPMSCVQGTNFVTWRALVRCAPDACPHTRRQQQLQSMQRPWHWQQHRSIGSSSSSIGNGVVTAATEKI